MLAGAHPLEVLLLHLLGCSHISILVAQALAGSLQTSVGAQQVTLEGTVTCQEVGQQAAQLPGVVRTGVRACA